MLRPRGGGSTAAPRRGRSGGVRPVYENFRPVSEWQQDDESHILKIYLPGFMKEQIKVTTEGKNTVRVRGERLVAGNKWNRFAEDFQVPGNGEADSVRAKYQGGVLYITIPKKEPKKPQEAFSPQLIQEQPTPQKGQDKVSLEASTSQEDEINLEPQKTLGDQDGDGKQHILPINRDRIFPTEESVKAVVQNAKKGSNEHKDKHIASERQGNVKEKTVYDEGKKSADGKELPEATTAKKTKLEKDGGTAGIPEKKAGNKELHGALTKEKYKKAGKGLAGLNEERQLLVNMGIAILVIVALAAHITYTFVSGNRKN